MPELYDMPDRYSRISPAARAAADVDHIVRAIDWDPTCLPGDERRAIVRQILDLATPLPAARETAFEKLTGEELAQWREVARLNRSTARLLAEYDRRGAIEQRADEVANGEGWSYEESELARHILGERP